MSISSHTTPQTNTKTRQSTRFLDREDFEAWFPLWVENNNGTVDPNVTDLTWSRIIDPSAPIYGIGIFDEHHKLAGFLHYVLHPVTGSLAPACYMQDLFISKNDRRKGCATALLHALHEEHKQQKWARIYWLADQKDESAQNLYRTFGTRLDFSFHIII